MTLLTYRADIGSDGFSGVLDAVCATAEFCGAIVELGQQRHHHTIKAGIPDRIGDDRILLRQTYGRSRGGSFPTKGARVVNPAGNMSVTFPRSRSL